MNKIVALLFFIFLGIPGFSQQFSVQKMQCVFKTEPLAINTANPDFSWQLVTGKRAVIQTAYRLLIADDAQLLYKNIGNIWDSKKVNGDQSSFVLFRGKALKAGAQYFWKLMVWSNKNEMASSKVASFRIGLLGPGDWGKAKWIGYQQMPDSLRTVPGVANVDTKRKLGPDKLKQRVIVPIFRKEFLVAKRVRQAIMYISGLGHYELSLNNKKIGNSFLAPGWTHYDKRVLYNAYDVTASVKEGQNAISVIVGNGFFNISRERYIKLAIAYGYPQMICRMLVTYSDGTRADIVSDASWRTASSPVTFSSIFGGEDYDANLENINWNNTNDQQKKWRYAAVVTAPKGKLEAEMDYPVIIKDSFTVKTILHPKDSVYVYDFGQNLSGIVELKVKGKKGQVVKLTPAELLHPGQLANQNATGKPYYFSYTLKGEGIETWRPRFTYTGFRYVQVEGATPVSANAPGNIATIINLKSLHTTNSSPSNGSFECSNKLFNDINRLIKWAITSNLQSVVTDCPHREKLSWLEQDYLMGGSLNVNTNVYQLYRKLVRDMMDAQTAEGLVPDVSPEFVFFDDKGFGFRDSPEWGSASVIVPWLVYKWYGDTALLGEAYPMMKRYVAYLKAKTINNLLDYGLGDWFDYGPGRPGEAQLTPKALTATAIYYYDLKLLASVAATLNNKKDAAYFADEATLISKTFNDSFYNTQTKVYATGSQTAMAMPLSVGLVTEQDRVAVLQNLVDSITFSGKKLTAGDIGFHFLVEALQQGNCSQLIYDMNYRDDVPGYGYQLKKGATALTESWPALEEVSNNHLMLGHIMQWFYEGLAGIQQQPLSVGYKRIIIKPEIVGDIRFVKANHETIYGDIRVKWEKKGNRFTLNVSIPPNTKASVYLPAAEGDRIFENNKPVQSGYDLKWIGFSEGRAIIEVGSGNYSFTVNK